jgi:hypothetical protein
VDLAVDHHGNVIVPDVGNRRIRIISVDGEVRTLAGSGLDGSKDGPPLEASPSPDAPTTVATRPSGPIRLIRPPIASDT